MSRYQADEFPPGSEVLAIPRTDPPIKWIEVHDDPEVGPHPLHLVDESHALLFHEKNRLLIEQDVFVRGVLATRSRDNIEAAFGASEDWLRESDDAPQYIVRLKLGNHEYTKLETQILYNAWTRGRADTLKNLSRSHRQLIIACIFAAMTQGWDQASMAGAAIQVMNDLGKPTQVGSYSDPITTRSTDVDIDLNYNNWLLGVTVGVPFFVGGILGLFITDPITSFYGFGRRGAICVAAIFSLISVVGCASVHRWEHLLGFRIMLGVGMAGKASIVPILLSETSPKNVRGFLLVLWQLFVAFGLAAGSVANISLYRLDVASSWRYMFIAAIVPALILISLIRFSPESPRWLLKESGSKARDQDETGRDQDEKRGQKLVEKACLSLIDLRGEPVPILAAGEIFLMHRRLIVEQHILQGKSPVVAREMSREAVKIKHISWWPRVKVMFRHSVYMKRAHLAAAAVMVSQQLCGINLLAFIADTFLRASTFHHSDPRTSANPKENMTVLGASLGLMIGNFLFTIIALFHIDRTDGRRRLLNISFPCMAASLLGAALVLRRAVEPSKGLMVGYYIFLGIFVIAYSIGEGPAAFVISAEVFPLVNRELGMSLAVCWNFLGAGLLAVFSPSLLNAIGQFWVLLLFSGTNLVAWFICYWLVPNTGNEDLEDVFAQLAVPPLFLLKHKIKALAQNAIKLIHYSLEWGSVDWEDCGYGEDLGTPEGAWVEHEKTME